MGRAIILDCLFVITLSIVFFKDLKTKIIPDYLNLILFLLGVIKIIFSEGDFEKSIIGMGVYPLILILIYGYVSDILKREVVGFGDIKLLGAVGFYNGYSGFYDILILHNIIFTLGFFVALPLYIFKKDVRDKEIAFAPFIVVGTLIFNFGRELFL